MITDLIDYVAFRGERLTLVWQNEEAYVAIRPICEQLGLNWKSQHRKLAGAQNGWTCGHMTTTGADGKRYDMTCLHVVELPLWLASISPTRIHAGLRETLIAYRKECAIALFNHVKARLLGERDAMRNSLVRLQADVIARKPLWVKVQRLADEGLSFEDIWRAVKRPRHVIIEAVEDLIRIGLLAKAPSGMPLAALPRPSADTAQLPLPLMA